MSTELALRLHNLGIDNPKQIAMHCAAAGLIEYPVPKASKAMHCLSTGARTRATRQEKPECTTTTTTTPKPAPGSES